MSKCFAEKLLAQKIPQCYSFCLGTTTVDLQFFDFLEWPLVTNGGRTNAVNIVVTCTKRKTVRAPHALQFRNTPGNTLEEKSANWIARLLNESFECVQASRLYAGEQWQISRSLTEIAAQRQLHARLWVVSAGYGLVRADESLKPYSATFSRSHPDSILSLPKEPQATLLQRWWKALSSWRPIDSGPRSIAEIADKFPDVPLLIVASSTYLSALSDDIIDARNALSDEDLMTIISAGTTTLGSLTGNLLPCDARLQAALGGSLMSLNARIARRVLANSNRTPLSFRELARIYKRLLSTQPAIQQYDRKSLTNTQVEKYILKKLSGNPEMRASPMLRQLRDEGFACEQKRFDSLYRKVVAFNE